MAEDARWTLEFERRAERDMARLDRQIARRVIVALRRLLDQDPSLDLQRLRGSDEWRLRVGDWRVRRLRASPRPRSKRRGTAGRHPSPSKAPGHPTTSVEAPRDGWSSYAVKAPVHAAEGAAPVRRTVDPSAVRDGWLSYAPRDARTELPAVSPSPFQWDAFGIGVGTALLSMLLLAGLVGAARQRRGAPRAA